MGDYLSRSNSLSRSLSPLALALALSLSLSLSLPQARLGPGVIVAVNVREGTCVVRHGPPPF